MEQLSKRFIPVELTAIQSQCFHDRHQTAKESVDEFAQELKKLFHKAYSNFVTVKLLQAVKIPTCNSILNVLANKCSYF